MPAKKQDNAKSASNKGALVPEKWGQKLDKLIKESERQHKESQSSLSRVEESSEEAKKSANSTLEAFLTLQKELTAREEEISRLKEGYDSKILKSFFSRFVRISRILDEMENEFSGKTHQKNYKILARLMRDALEACGVEQFKPEIGSDYREADSRIDDDPIVIETQDPKQDFMIAEVKSVGYVLVGEEKTKAIIPAKVSIYRTNAPKSGEK